MLLKNRYNANFHFFHFYFDQGLTAPFHDDEAIVEKFLSLDKKLKAHLGDNGSGATCVSAFVTRTSSDEYHIKVANLGDSRAVIIRPDCEFE
jgi:serine/threonine protein phosphatase PrpC